MTDTRYQFQPWYVKLYRRIRYTPKWIFIGLWWEFRYGRDTWTTAMSMAQRDMQWYWHLEEILKTLQTSSPVDSGSDGPNVGS